MKVTPDDAIQVKIYPWKQRGRFCGYLIAKDLPIGPIKWKQISDKNEMENHLLERNKRNLQQMAKKETPPSQEYFQEVLSNSGTSTTSTKILEDEVTTDLDQFLESSEYGFSNLPELRKNKNSVSQFMVSFVPSTSNKHTNSKGENITITFWDPLHVLEVYGFR